VDKDKGTFYDVHTHPHPEWLFYLVWEPQGGASPALEHDQYANVTGARSVLDERLRILNHEKT
jgi:hypothetical protein